MQRSRKGRAWLCLCLAAFMLLQACGLPAAITDRVSMRTFTGELNGVCVIVEAGTDALPAGANLRLAPVAVDAANALAVDISFADEAGKEIEPTKPVRVTLTGDSIFANDRILHVADDGSVTEPLCTALENGVTFYTDSFSTFVIVHVDPYRTLTVETENYSVSVTYDENAGVPEEAELVVRELTEGTEEYDAYLTRAKDALPESELTYSRLLDISIQYEGAEVQPETPVQVSIRLLDHADAPNETPHVFHFPTVAPELNELKTKRPLKAAAAPAAKPNETDESKAESTETPAEDAQTAAPTEKSAAEQTAPNPEAEQAAVPEPAAEPEAKASIAATMDVPAPETVPVETQDGALTFTADGFSVYAVIYTVDFHYTQDGETYTYTLTGGGYVSLRALLESLSIIADDPATEADEAQAFMDDIASVTFSDPALVYVAHPAEDTTVGAIKAAQNLTAEISADADDEFITEIDATLVPANEWGLVSLRPFDTEETLTLTMNSGDVVTVQVTDSQTTIRNATVHYGYMQGNTFREFEQFTPPTSGFGNPAYLIYDVLGYQYAGKTTHVYTYWGRQYTEDVLPIINGNGSGDYYVYYEPRPTAFQGGDSSNAHTYPDEPTVTKSSTENRDTGTNTISLEVEGKRNTVKSKADIIVIYDVSGSMKFGLGFNSETDIPAEGNGLDYFLPDDNPNQRHYATKKALKELATSLMAGQTGNDPAVQMSIVPFSTVDNSPTAFTGDPNTFSQNVDSLVLGGGTNWEAALQAANNMQVREDADTYVLFLTDGNPTFRITRGNESDDLLTGYYKTINGRQYHLSGISHNDGNNFYDQLGIFGTGNTDWDKTTPESLTDNYDAALTVARAIVGKNKRLYGIGISSEPGNLVNLIQAEGVGGKYYNATSSESMEDAINDIKIQIKEITFGYSDVQISDGITALTQTVQKTGMTTLPDSDDFEYFKGHAATQEEVNAGKASAAGETVWEPWTAEQMTQEGAGRASYNSTTGAVEWNLGEKFMLEEGVRYKVDFTVWPSQETYDLLADLNNGLKDYDSLGADVKAQIHKSGEGASAVYTLKTNEDNAGYTYKKATKEKPNGEVIPNGEAIPGAFAPVIPLHLRTDKIGVRKSFNNLLDSRDPTQIQLELWGDRLFKTFTLTKDGGWRSDNNYISCGLLTVDKDTGEMYIYETGHDFTLKETGEDSIYWELTADTYRPMVINDVLHMLTKVSAPAGMSASAKYYSADGKEYYRIGDSVYRDEGADAILHAVNDHRSFLNLSKAVVNENGETVPSSDLFNFKLTFHESRAEDNIVFTIYDTVNQTYINDASVSTATITVVDGRPYYQSANNTEFTLKLKQGWNVRFLNLSNGTTYTIKEELGDSEYEFVKIEGNAVKKEGDNSISLDTNMLISSGNSTMSGTIAEPNAMYSIQFSNKAPKKKLQIFKTDQSGITPLQDAEFSLYGSDYLTEEGEINPAALPLAQNQKTDANGILDLGERTFGTYYLVETKAPKGYMATNGAIQIVLSYTPTYNQDNSSLSLSGNGVTPLKNDEDKIIGYQFTVTNSAGYELPATGGPGTTLYTAIGAALLLLGAAWLLLRRRRQA